VGACLNSALTRPRRGRRASTAQSNTTDKVPTERLPPGRILPLSRSTAEPYVLKCEDARDLAEVVEREASELP